MKLLLRRLLEFDAHHRVAIALAVGLIAWGISFGRVRLLPCLLLSWDAFAICSLLIAWAGMLFTDARKRVREATLQDSNRAAISACLVLGSVAGLFGAGMLLSSARNLASRDASGYAILAAFTVASSWFLVHTMMALHYAHVCYRLAAKSREHPPDLGVVFPDESLPDFLDFAYFSFVIGMTCQVSDVQITSRQVRRLALMHGLLSFGFNTVIVAISLNLAASLL